MVLCVFDRRMNFDYWQHSILYYSISHGFLYSGELYACLWILKKGTHLSLNISQVLSFTTGRKKFLMRIISYRGDSKTLSGLINLLLHNLFSHNLIIQLELIGMEKFNQWIFSVFFSICIFSLGPRNISQHLLFDNFGFLSHIFFIKKIVQRRILFKIFKLFIFHI